MSAEDNPYDMDAEEIRTSGQPTPLPTLSISYTEARHRACFGLTWDVQAGHPVDCACPCHTHSDSLEPPHTAAA